MFIFWSLISNIFVCEAARSIKAKFHVEILWVETWKVHTNCSGYVIKMAPCQHMTKIFKIFSETRRPIISELGIQHQGLGPYRVCWNDDPGLTLTCLTTRSFYSLMLLYEKIAKLLYFLETIEVFEMKVVTNSWLSEHMNTYEYQRWRSFCLTFIQVNQAKIVTLRFIYYKFLSSYIKYTYMTWIGRRQGL